MFLFAGGLLYSRYEYCQYSIRSILNEPTKLPEEQPDPGGPLRISTFTCYLVAGVPPYAPNSDRTLPGPDRAPRPTPQDSTASDPDNR